MIWEPCKSVSCIKVQYLALWVVWACPKTELSLHSGESQCIAIHPSWTIWANLEVGRKIAFINVARITTVGRISSLVKSEHLSESNCFLATGVCIGLVRRGWFSMQINDPVFVFTAVGLSRPASFKLSRTDTFWWRTSNCLLWQCVLFSWAVLALTQMLLYVTVVRAAHELISLLCWDIPWGSSSMYASSALPSL